MKTLRPQKRSVSPFGNSPAASDDPLASLREAIAHTSFEPAHFLPGMIEKVSLAPANDAPSLDGLIQSILKFRETLQAENLSSEIFEAMVGLFERKTELFMIDHNDGQDFVLFAKERDALAGRFFAPFTETQPGLFSEFVTRWIDTDSPDRILHFLDFCSGSKNPTFEHYLLFTHPALTRVLGNKGQLRALLEKAQPLLGKLSSPTWEHNIRAALTI